MFFSSQATSSSSSSRTSGRHSSSSNKPHNRNYWAAFFEMITVALLCTCLIQPSWFAIATRTANAARTAKTCPKHLTLYQFFDYGFFETSVYSNSTTGASPLRLDYHSSSGTLRCLTPAIVNVFKVILMLVVVGIILSLIGFLLDIFGTKSRLSLTLRSNGLFTIPIVLICAGVVSLAYYITVLLERENRHSYTLEVSFDHGFFTLSAAGATALLATACTLFTRLGTNERHRSRSRHRRPRPSRVRDSRLMLVESIDAPPLTAGDPPPPYSL